MTGPVESSGVAATLQGLEAQFQTLYTSGIIGIVRADIDRIVDANDSFLAMVGYTAEELRDGALRWSAMTPPEYATLDAHALKELETTGRCTPFEKEYIRKDGTRVPIQIAAAVLRTDPLEWVCYILDLSAPKSAAATERTLGTILEHVPVGVIVVDGEGHLLLMNGVGRQISGEAPGGEIPVAQQADRFVLREPRTGRQLAPEETPIARALAGETVRNYEYVFRPLGAERDRWVRTVAVPLRSDLGESLGVVAVFEDVTEERTREQAREDFLSTVAHDLKTPLTSLKGFTQLLERRLMREGAIELEVLESYLHRIQDTTVRMEDMLLDLLDVARLRAGERLDLTPESADLVEVVRRVVEHCAGLSEAHAVRLEIDEPVLRGVWDARRLERALENLLVNAITYSPGGGHIVVTLTREGTDTAWAAMRVSDGGVGIPERDLPRIFDRYYRGSNVVDRFSGTGVGLAGVKQIVEQHGGRITVTSREGAGSTFSVWLPLDKHA